MISDPQCKSTYKCRLITELCPQRYSLPEDIEVGFSWPQSCRIIQTIKKQSILDPKVKHDEICRIYIRPGKKKLWFWSIDF